MSEVIDSSIISCSSGLLHPVLLKAFQFGFFKADIGVKLDRLDEKVKADWTRRRFCLSGLVRFGETWTARYNEDKGCAR